MLCSVSSVPQVFALSPDIMSVSFGLGLFVPSLGFRGPHSCSHGEVCFWCCLFLVSGIAKETERSVVGGGICAPPAFISPVPELMGREGVPCGPGLGLDFGVCKGPQLAR